MAITVLLLGEITPAQAILPVSVVCHTRALFDRFTCHLVRTLGVQWYIVLDEVPDPQGKWRYGGGQNSCQKMELQ